MIENTAMKLAETDEDVSPEASPTTQTADDAPQHDGVFFNPPTKVCELQSAMECFQVQDKIGVRTGFTPPYPSIQVATILMFLSALIEFYVVVLPSLPLCVVAPIAGTVFAFLYSLLVLFWVRTSIVDPVDPRVLKKIHEEHEADVEDGIVPPTKNRCACLYASMNDQSRGGPKPTNDSIKFCTLCETNVHSDSAHCLRCNMCVYRFDHHCSMLNKCIGEANYFDFFRTMLCALTVAGFLVILHVYSIMELTFNPVSNHPFIGKPVVFGVAGAFLSLHVMVCIYLAQLVGAHLQLRAKNMTLYQYTLELLNQYPLEPESSPSFEIK